MFIGLSLQWKPHLLSIVLFSGFKTPQVLQNPPSQTVPGKYHGSGEQLKRGRLPDRANFHSSQPRQMFLIFNTVYVIYSMRAALMTLLDIALFNPQIAHMVYK